jgi:Fe-S cluster assembly iron-binding protein IscA
LTLDESTENNDIVTTSRAIKVAYNKDFDEYLNDVVIDYSDTLYAKGFSISGSMLGDC